MKRFITSKLTIALIILSIFVLGQLLGAFAIKHYFIQSKIKELQPHLTKIKEDVSKRGKIVRNNDFLIKAYNLYGNEINIIQEENSSNSSPNPKMNNILTSYLPTIANGKSVIKMKEIPGYSSKAIVIGQPIVQEGKVKGGIFLLKPARAYNAALNGFYLVFFTTLAIGTIIILIFLTLFIKEKNQLEQMRKDYIANISHELKTPLASIKALTETLSDHVVSEQSKIDHYYRIILRESARLEKLITDLLELSRLQGKKIAFTKSVIDTNQLIERVSETFLAMADDIDLQFYINERAKNLPQTFTNADRIIQVLTILLDNAFKFTGENGYVSIDARTTSKKVEIMVSDNGPGISKEYLPFVFERFNKEDVSHNKIGSGLGLSIANEIMEQLGEKISVISQLDAGTTFTITIKRA